MHTAGRAAATRARRARACCRSRNRRRSRARRCRACRSRGSRLVHDMPDRCDETVLAIRTPWPMTRSVPSSPALIASSGTCAVIDTIAPLTFAATSVLMRQCRVARAARAANPKPLEKYDKTLLRSGRQNACGILFRRATRCSHLMLGTEAELTTLSNSEDVHEKRLLIVLAFALGGGAMWYFTNERGGNGGRRTTRSGGPGGRPGAGGFGRRRTVAAQPPLVTVGWRAPRFDRRRRGARHDAGKRVGHADGESDGHRAREFRGRRLRRVGRRADRAHEPRRGSSARRGARESRRRRESAAQAGRLERPWLDVRFRARRRALARRASQARLNSIVARLRDG